jgi:hypothetical protein
VARWRIATFRHHPCGGGDLLISLVFLLFFAAISATSKSARWRWWKSLAGGGCFPPTKTPQIKQQRK